MQYIVAYITSFIWAMVYALAKSIRAVAVSKGDFDGLSNFPICWIVSFDKKLINGLLETLLRAFGVNPISLRYLFDKVVLNAYVQELKAILIQPTWGVNRFNVHSYCVW